MFVKVRSTVRRLFFPTWVIPIALLTLTLISYGLRAFDLGFFWDDWPYLWFFHRFGPAGILNAFQGDRPFLSFIYITSLTLFGHSIQAWQLFGLAARWLCSLGLWWVWAEAWPEHKHKAAWAAMLFTVYPGFTQQWIAVIYGQAFILFAALFFSTALTLWIVRRRHRLTRGWIVASTLLALALSYFNMFSTEYFFGLELLRPVLLWLVFVGESACLLNKTGDHRRTEWLKPIRQAAVWWAPYLALMIAFVIWRAFIHPFTGYSLTTLQGVESSPLTALWSLVQTIVEDFVVASAAAWGQPLTQLSGFIEKNPANGLRLLAVILVTAVIGWLYLIRVREQAAQDTHHPADETRWTWGRQAVIVGLFAFLVSGWPIWITGLPMRMGFPWDRYALAMAVGISLMLAGLVDVLAGPDRSRHALPRKAAVIAAMLALAVGLHFNTALLYRQDWTSMSSFLWQLTWRAPAVKPNTLFASAEMPFQFFEDDSLSAPLNWTYDPAGSSVQMPYILYDLDTRRLSMPAYQPGQVIAHDFRAARFTGSTDQVLVFTYNPPGCVRILDPIYDTDQYQLPDRLQLALPISNPRGLIADREQPPSPPADIFGSEPRHRWCYFFEKADLARQLSDWEAIIQLSRQSIGAGLRPADPVEYLPFIEAFSHITLYDDAIQLTETAYKTSAALRPALCGVWKRSYQPLSDPTGRFRARVENVLGCAIQ